MLINWPGIATKRADLRDAFQKYALVIPALMPMVYSVGRAPGEILLVTYLLWGILSLRLRDFRDTPLLGILYLAVAISFGLGIIDSLNPARGMKAYLEFSVSLLTVFFTLMCLREDRFRGDIQRWLGMAALIAIGVFVIRFGYYALQPDFNPAIQVNGMAAATLLPLTYVFFHGHFDQGKGNRLFLFLLLIYLPPLLLADSRTEVVMVLAGLIVLFGFYLHRLGLLVVLGLIALPLIVLIDAYLWGRIFNLEQGWFAVLDRFSSIRLSIWKLPFENPPPNPWIGVGMANSGLYIQAADLPVKHMHNFVLEIWYETGWIGFFTFFSFCAVLLRGLPRAYRSLEGERRLLFSAILGSAVAVIIAAALDKGYTAHLFSIYLMFCMAALFFWSRDLPK